MRVPPLSDARARRARKFALAATLGWLLALAPAASAQVYFTAFFAEGGTGIERAQFDGSELQELQFQPIGFADAIALDVAHGAMYWTDTSAGTISRSNLNGSEAQVLIIDGGREPIGIALDLPHEKVYWTDSEGVKRASLDGTVPELLTKETARGFIALDLATQEMFWADWPSGNVRSAPMAPAPLVTSVAKGQACPLGIAVDETNAKIYWLGIEVKEKPKCEKSSAITRANLDGSEAKVIVKRPEAAFEGGLAVDPAAGKIYWSEAELHDISSADLAGAGEQVLFKTGGDIPEGLAIETADPRPRNTSAPTIEGSAVVGSPLFCDPGAWTGTGSVSYSYQWVVPGEGAIEGATTSVFVPFGELAGTALQCVVTAADAVATTVASSAALTVGAYPSAPPAPAPAQLIAGIALARLTAHGTTARVPVFASSAGVATLTATPRRAARRASSHRAAQRRRRSRRSSTKHSTAAALKVTRRIPSGRSAITLTRLVRGLTYTLTLNVEGADGQVASSTATLRVPRR
jgi:Low-density lipoprotein receptor repeat class B